MTIEEDWERNLVASCSIAEDDCLTSSDEDGMMHVLQLYHLELHYLQELKEFALFNKIQELFDYFTKSSDCVTNI